MADFFEMGGYGAYIWPAYGASALVIGGLAFAVWRRGKALTQKLARRDGENTPTPGSQGRG